MSASAGAARERLFSLYRTMLRIRRFEERVGADAGQGLIPGPIHLSIGQEASAAGVIGNLRDDDFMLTSHRPHGHALAKGVPMNALLAEIWGKRTGICGGKGGSMHIAHRPSGFLGANGVVGGGTPLAAGVGMAIRHHKTDQVVASFFGEGAVPQGQFHEGATMAAVFSLPVLLVCENNNYAETVAAPFYLADGSVAERLAGYGRFRIEQVDGMDVEVVDRVAGKLVAWIRETGRPAALECLTMRFGGHFEGDEIKYRNEAELAPWLARDPIAQAEGRLRAMGAEDEDFASLEAALAAEVAEAAEFASSSAFPDPDEALEGVLV
jgi:TPP-dependent pyruvate/acetoin dehydrogenase alpha subunit